MEKINECNFREYIIALIEGDLNVNDKTSLYAFLDLHPEFKEELDLFEDTKLQTESSVSFPLKSKLKNIPTQYPINNNNFQDWFIAYHENDLSVEEKRKVELFLIENPVFQNDFILLGEVKLQPEKSFAYFGKNKLKRKISYAQKARLRWQIPAAAASLIFIATLTYLFLFNRPTEENNVVINPVIQDSHPPNLPQIGEEKRGIPSATPLTPLHATAPLRQAGDRGMNPSITEVIPFAKEKQERIILIPSKNTILINEITSAEICGNLRENINIPMPQNIVFEKPKLQTEVPEQSLVVKAINFVSDTNATTGKKIFEVASAGMNLITGGKANLTGNFDNDGELKNYSFSFGPIAFSRNK